jgi:flagellar hook-length control protein FliK
LSLSEALPPSPADRAGAAGTADGSGTSAAASTATNVDLSALVGLVGAMPGDVNQPGSAERTISVPVSDPSWPRAVAAQVQLFAAGSIQSATLRLSPEHLGPVQVHLDMQAAQINVSFVAAHAETRAALEQSVPMLRAMLANGGLTLGQTQVQGEARSGPQFANQGARAQEGIASAAEPESVRGPGPRTLGLLDEYA